MQTNHGAEWRAAHVESAPFYTNKEVDHLIKDVEVSLQLLHWLEAFLFCSFVCVRAGVCVCVCVCEWESAQLLFAYK